MLRLIHNTQSPEANTTNESRETFLKCVGICEDGELIMVDSLHWNGVSLYHFVGVTQQFIDLRNDVEHLKENYKYLWTEAVDNGTTEESLEEYLESLVEQEVNYHGNLFFGHDDSYTSYISQEDRERYDESSDSEYVVEGFECVGGGTSSQLPTLKEVWDTELWERAQRHHEAINRKKVRTELRSVK